MSVYASKPILLSGGLTYEIIPNYFPSSISSITVQFL